MLSLQSAARSFPFLRNDPALTRELLEQADFKTLPPATTLFRQGDACTRIAFVLNGEIRVFKTSATGREITLYDVGAGDTCILNASCILSHISYPAHAVTTARTEILLLPAAAFRDLVERYGALQRFVYKMLSDRLTAMMDLVEEIVFNRMDRRLFDYLVEKSENGVIETTHHAIANDLGTSREVVSRLLKDMQARGMLRASRTHIEILDYQADRPRQA